MRSYKNYLITLLAVMTLIAGFLAWSEAREIARLKEALAANRPEVIARNKAWAQQQLTTSQTKAGPSDQSNPEDANAPRDFESTRRRGEAAFRAMMENPEYQKLRSIAQKGRLDRLYAALFKKLGLSPSLLEKFKELLIEKQNAMVDVVMVAREQGLDPRTDPKGFRALVASTQSEIDASIRSTIGDEAYSTYQNYQSTMTYRNVVDQLSERLSYGTSPLTDAQTEEMVNILASTSTSSTSDSTSGAFAPPLANRQSGLNDDAMNRAQGILTPDQYTALQQLQQEQQAQAQLRNLMRQQMQPPSGDPGGGPPPTG